MRKISAIAIVALLMTATVQTALATGTGTSVNGQVITLSCPGGTIGIASNPQTLNFGTLYPLQPSASQPLTLAISASGYAGVGECLPPSTIPVTITASNWIGVVTPSNIMTADSTAVSGAISQFGIPTSLNVGGNSVLSFIVTPSSGAAPDTYSQTITITGTY